ncbi:hypothetical protein OQA88_12136 [Cercophora sp. LCS_1]
MSAPTTRLRKTFRYNSSPSPSDDESEEFLDETEQESLITSLTAQNAHRNAQFRLALLCLPGLSSLPYILGLFHRATSLVSLLALSSLAATGWLLWVLPATVTGIGVVDGYYQTNGRRLSARSGSGSGMGMGMGMGLGMGRRLSGSGMGGILGGEGMRGARSPMVKHLPWLNVVLAVVVAVAGYLNYRMVGGYEGVVAGMAGLGYLPVVNCVVVIVAKMMMAGVDPEAELNGLRYGYKGA